MDASSHPKGKAKVAAYPEIRRLGNWDRSFRMRRNGSASRAKCLPSGLDRRLLAHLPREGVVDPASAARLCSGGSALRKIGEDVTGMVDHVPASWKSLPPRGR
jgi:hypothetical protein